MCKMTSKALIKPPRAKKNNRPTKNLPLPLFQDSNNVPIKFTGTLNGLSVIIDKVDEMEKIYYNGFFGKANLSRGFPRFRKDPEKPNVIRKRQYERRSEWAKKYAEKPTVSKIIVVPDSGSEEEDDVYFNNLRAEYQTDSNLVKENLNLNLEEALFLCNGMDCLNVYDGEKLMSGKELWDVFCEIDQYFVQNYAAYFYFRSKNWVVKSGIKFGGDFLLYKEGPPFYHASYLVIIDVLDEESLERKEEAAKRSMETVNIIGLNRLCETAGKELLICQILWPKNFSGQGPEDISKLSVKTVLVNRWILPQERENKKDN